VIIAATNKTVCFIHRTVTSTTYPEQGIRALDDNLDLNFFDFDENPKGLVPELELSSSEKEVYR